MEKKKSSTEARRPSKEEQVIKNLLHENVTQQKRINEKLRKELKTKRIRLSAAIADIIDYCESNENNDPFITGFKYKDNPFREKGGCTII